MTETFEFADISTTHGKPTVTLDKFGRLRVSTAAQTLMNVQAALSPWVVVAYDPTANAIALQKAELVSQAPEKATAKLDKRGYFRVIKLIRDYGLDFADGKPMTYRYDGEVSVSGQRMYSFRLISS